ncbi:MAG TPA: hypothetical protein VEN78_14970 [Bradyrhizobium sp.]|nr:hypothetical protein [Bradyrhizobium sp.]
MSRTRCNARCSANGATPRPLGATGDQDNHSEGFGENQSAGASGAARGTRASANTSGPDFTWAKIAGEIADLKLRTERRKTCFFCRTGFVRANSFENAIQPFDLMSRRHPLSSTEPSDLKSTFKKQIVSEGSTDVPASSRRQFS